MKLALGAVQFGLDYGAFNSDGRPSQADVADILAYARQAGVAVLDTARAYGASEEVLGKVSAPSRFDIVTKCPDLSTTADPAEAVAAAFDASCAALGVSKVYGYLLHNSEDLARPGVWDVLSGLAREGRARRVGVSGYDPAEVAALCERFPITLTQLPANVLTPWFAASPLPPHVETHVRSAFLQGFLLADPDALPARFAPWRETLVAFRTQAAAQGLSPLEAALAPLLAAPHISRVIVGVDSLPQLEEIIAAAEKATGRRDIALGPFPGVTADLTDPRRWNRTP